MSVIETALYDIQCLKRVLYSGMKMRSFNSVYVFSLIRDLCLVIHQIQDDFNISEELILDEDIRKIRQNIKIFGTGGKGGNKGVYEKIRHIHESAFEEWENNIGFYVLNGQILGSTLYSTYIFKGSKFENPFQLMVNKELQKSYMNFVQVTLPKSLLTVEALLNQAHITEETVVTLNEDYFVRDFDVRAELFFNDNFWIEEFQSMVFRLILSLQEIEYIRYIYINFKNREKADFLDGYYFIRVLSRYLDTVYKNIDNIIKYQYPDFEVWINNIKVSSREELVLIFKSNKYKREINEVKKLRDMLHYDTETYNSQDNFYGYYQANLDYLEEWACKTYEEIVMPIREAILDFIQVNKQQSYSLVKMLYLRWKINRERK